MKLARNMNVILFYDKMSFDKRIIKNIDPIISLFTQWFEFYSQLAWEQANNSIKLCNSITF